MKPIAAPSASWLVALVLVACSSMNPEQIEGRTGSCVSVPKQGRRTKQVELNPCSPCSTGFAPTPRNARAWRLDQVKVLTVESVTWSDGSLGCPEPGMMYTQALVRGHRIRVDAAGTTLLLSRGHAEHLRALPAGARAGTVAGRSDLSIAASATSRASLT